MAGDKGLLSSELLRVLGFTADMPRGAVLERVHVDTLRFSRQLVGLLLFAVELGDVASVEQLADQAQARLDKLNEQIEAAQEAQRLAGQLLNETNDIAQQTAAAAEEEARRHKADADHYVAQSHATAADIVERARADAKKHLADTQADAAAYAERVFQEHAGLQSAIATRQAEHDELERKIGEHREALAGLRLQAKKLMLGE